MNFTIIELKSLFCRRYQEYHENIEAERMSFRRRNPRRRGHRAPAFLPNLQEIKKFDEWLQEHISEKLVSNAGEVEGDVKCIYKPPAQVATKYRSMWAFGNHLRVASIESHL